MEGALQNSAHNSALRNSSKTRFLSKNIFVLSTVKISSPNYEFFMSSPMTHRTPWSPIFLSSHPPRLPSSSSPFPGFPPLLGEPLENNHFRMNVHNHLFHTRWDSETFCPRMSQNYNEVMSLGNILRLSQNDVASFRNSRHFGARALNFYVTQNNMMSF